MSNSPCLVVRARIGATTGHGGWSQRGESRAWWTGQGTPDEALQKANERLIETLARRHEQAAAKTSAIERIKNVGAQSTDTPEPKPEPLPGKADMPKEAVDAPSDEPEPLTTTPAMEPELAAATAEVEAVVDDGIVTAEEARKAADEAAKVLSAAAQETPDSPEPERAYDSDGEIARLVMELCDDPEEMRKMLARARYSRSDAQREAEESSGQQKVPDEVRSAAARVMSRLSQDAQESDRADGKPRRERRERVSDVDLLRRAADDCKREGRHTDVVKEVEAFLRRQRHRRRPDEIPRPTDKEVRSARGDAG